MLGRIARQYRRLGVGAALLGVFFLLHVALHGMSDDVDLAVNAVTLVAALLTVLIVVGAAIIFLTVLMPNSLPLVEIVLLALIINSPLMLVTNALGFPSWTEFLIIFAILLAVERMLMGDWQPDILRRDMVARPTRFRVALPPDEVWRRIVPLPAHSDTYFRPATEFMTKPDGAEGDFVLHIKRPWGLKDSVETVFVEENDPPHLFRYRTRPSTGSVLPSERIEIRLTPVEDGTEVSLGLTFLDAPATMRLRLWLGHDARDYALSVRNRLTGRADGTLHSRQIART